MATDMFLKLTGIEGESTVDAHQGEIEVLTWTMGMAQSGGAQVGRGRGAGKVHVQDLALTKLVDRASCKLMLACCSGKRIAEGVLVIRKAGQTPLEYLKITMDDIIVSSVSLATSSQEDRPTESISLNFAKFRVEYKEQQPDGSIVPSGTMGWDIAANQSL
jgi:type VI secretion system secreted protein Hcp